MKKSNNLIFFGNERLSTGYSPKDVSALETLIKNGYNIIAVVANYERGTSRNSRELEVAKIAKKYDIPLYLPNKLSEIKEDLKNLNPQAGVLIAYGKIIPQSVIDIFPKGIINIHPSLLPTYRGSTPIEQAILDGAKETGVSVMQIVKAMDAGAVYAQQSIKLNQNKTKEELTEKLHKIGTDLLLEELPKILNGNDKPKEQDHQQATYTSQIDKSNGQIDTNKPAKQIEREIRAYATWPKSRLTIFDKQIIVIKAKLTDQQPEDNQEKLIITCNPGCLEIIELITPNGKKTTGPAFLRGYKPKS